ncbi:HK97-gp10 family putative phage morphogenesis protein [Halobacillus sp. A5]|uniref:HK97-gp10 family putative phage morphogenesis protein n=1 Tax=Halobacillus sp. A5 TaxID=2880263 RepID=UPI0020A62836|nr:HK97-gp10 family putative phage morphogenesis protein [Halobacillus sp. A5]MCP3025998.1 HK97 gp10 family phage protein [Halobacillus sp. A5]
MSNFGVQGLEKFDKLTREIAKMAKNLDGETKEDAMKAGAEFLKGKIEKHPNVPVSSQNKSHARDNFKVVKNKEDNVYEVGVSDKYFYLFFHEFGADKGFHEVDGKRFVTPAIAAKPFLRPSLENNSDKIQEIMAEVIRKSIKL